MKWLARNVWAFLWLLIARALAVDGPAFERVERVFRARCYECHSHEGKIKGGLVLDSKTGWEKGGESGPAVVRGKPEASLLIRAVSHVEKDLQMPPKEKISAEEIAILSEWIRAGAVDPREAKSDVATLKADSGWEQEYEKRLDWWSLRPMMNSAPPAVADAVWSREPVDRFIRAALDTNGVVPSGVADEVTIRRRLSFVLTGLPPVVHGERVGESVEAFVDRLLRSPHFGERFARHWMDVVRYTDTYGYEWDNPAKGAHEYRDYLIRAFNDDVGFDRLVREQVAGDLLGEERVHLESGTTENLIAPMFYHLGEHRHGSSLMFNGIHQDMVNNKIDAFSKAFLATTVACARCHDHKLEAVSQRDYYGLAALFTVPRWTTRAIDARSVNAASIERLKGLRSAVRGELARKWSLAALTGDGLKAWAAAHGDALKGVGSPLSTPLEFSKKAEEWRGAREVARKANTAFKSVRLEDWVMEGDGFTHGWVEDGTPLIALEGDCVVSGLLERGWHSHALSSKLSGSLRTPPLHRVAGRGLAVRVAGGVFGGHLVVDDHAFQNETVAFYKDAAPQWKAFADPALVNGAQQVAIEFCTSLLNPNFPPRTGLAAGSAARDFGLNQRSWVSVLGAVTTDGGGAPKDEQEWFTKLYGGVLEGDPWDRMADWLNGVATRWCAGTVEAGDVAVMQWMLGSGLLVNRAEPESVLGTLVTEYRRVEGEVQFPRAVVSMDERRAESLGYPLNVRGNVDTPGELVHPASLRMLGGSGVKDRRALADSLVESEHPLTARVYVNRVWQWIFGAGLVLTPDDFGRLGGRPSHPELLDWLAREFVREGWSTKRLVRRLVLSETFRRGGQASERAREADPSNRLLSYYATRRLEAEGIRDALLAVSGSLDGRLYGRSVLPIRSVEDANKRLFSGPLDGAGRRSIYLQMSIMQPPAFLVGFNLPDLKLPTGRRDVTNVPAQALTLLNDPFVREMARRWAQDVVGAGDSVSSRVAGMFRRAFGREATDGEVKRWGEALAEFGGDTVGGWEGVAHALFNTKEFIYYR
ncbi:MAG: hypothetical protein RIS92_213 [Verrucomicrobiota bacterium]